MTNESAKASVKSIERCLSDESRRRWGPTVALAAATLASAIASCDSSMKVVTLDGGMGGSATCPPTSGANLGIAQHPEEGNSHVVACSATNYHTVPPSSGPHYPSWPAYKTYSQPVPWGYLVHGLEHGAVVVVYNCPGGCPAEVAAAQAWIDGLPTDHPSCPGEKPRVILVPDPALDVRWAASAWAWTLRWCAFDASMFQQFFDAHYARASEAICRSSVEIDQSATGWCL